MSCLTHCGHFMRRRPNLDSLPHKLFAPETGLEFLGCRIDDPFAVPANQRQFGPLADNLRASARVADGLENREQSAPPLRQLAWLARDDAPVVNFHFDGHVTHGKSL